MTTAPLILHHYELSPFSEKIRCMLGYCDLPWKSAISPAMPPRPQVDPLTGGYRRIPVAQIGADIFCDTRIIAAEIAEIAGKPELAMENCSTEIRAFVALTDSQIFMATVRSGTPLKAIGVLLKNFSPWQTYRFIKDRIQIGRTSKIKPLGLASAKALLLEHTVDLERRLTDQTYLFGNTPTIADFSAYHVLRFRGKTGGLGFISGFVNLQNWFKRMASMGHGQQTDISLSEVFAEARNHAPRKIPKNMQQHPLIGQQVEIKPDDYARDAVVGELVGSNKLRWVLARQTPDFGTLHVHFPVSGYILRGLA